MNRKIRKLLIANRGEIACRIIRTCHNMGIKTVAVYSDADVNALHVAMADETVCIGPATATESYLVADKILAAAKLTSADAIHPGYGFLSENPEFSEACAENGIIFVGPFADSMRAMALKGAAKKLMEKASVPVVPGYHGDDQSLETLTAEIENIGFPVLIKAVAGGGGKGMRKVHAGDNIKAAIEAARREGQNAFGNGKLLIEKLIEVPRHIELQVFGDETGRAVHLFERDCSLQRRHQKVVEEAPAPGLSEEMRAAMGDAAVKAAEAIKYVGAGTVEFIVDVANGLENAPFYFMEMNTRLQVEHPVTEYITGEDLVEWQIRIAEGYALPLTQDEINDNVYGHAVEVRLYAEDPYNNFMPAVGKIGMFDPNIELPQTQRIDAGVAAGDTVSIHYDPMIGKLIAFGETREQAIEELVDLIDKTPVSGLVTNRDFLRKTLTHPDFLAGNVHTGFILEHEKTLLSPYKITNKDYAISAYAILADRQKRIPSRDPWDFADNFRINLQASETMLFDSNDNLVTVQLSGDVTHATVTINEDSFTAQNITLTEDLLSYTEDGLKQTFFADVSATTISLVSSKATLFIPRHVQTANTDDTDGPGTIVAPMPGKILEIKITNGDAVTKGQALLVMEAMKMEQTISAPKDGIVAGLTLSAGDQVSDHAVLLSVIDPEE